MAIEQFLSLTVLTDLALAALEDIVDDVALDFSGVASTIRSGHTQQKRESEVLDRIGRLAAAADLHPKLCSLHATWLKIKQLPNVTGFSILWKKFVETLDELDGASPYPNQFPNTGFRLITNKRNPRTLRLRSVVKSKKIGNDRKLTTDPSAFVALVTTLCAEYRKRKVWRFAPADRLALLRAYQLVESGVRPAHPMLPIRTDLWRPKSTYLALADPGRSHLRFTVRRSDLLNGTIVHVETIDRDGIDNRGQIEAYRIPAIRDVARIRVHIGDEAPCSVYVGRPVFEGWAPEKANDQNQRDLFDLARLKAIHTVAAACSGLFSLGVAECKIGLDGLTSTQAVETMKSLVANVIRDRTRQRLSAAFNINSPIQDDRNARRNPMLINDRIEVAGLAIELAKTGGFDKVTWDGAQDGASTPFLEQISPAQMISLVHKAHELGLETYISAGMRAEHMVPASQIGVGGVGIGIALHARSKDGAITHIKTDDVLTVLDNRDNAALTTLAGRGATALAQLDWMKAKGPLDKTQEAQRQKLLTKLLAFHNSNNASDRISAERNLTRIVEDVETFLVTCRNIRGHQSRITLGFSPQYSSQPATAINNFSQSYFASTRHEDPIFALADGQIRVAKKNKSFDEAQKIEEMLNDGDSEGLRCYLGYQ